MEKKVTFKEFFTVLWSGVWQAVCWVFGLFGYQDKSKCGVVIRRMFAGSLAIVAFAFAVFLLAAVGNAVYKHFFMVRDHVCVDEQFVSRYISYCDPGPNGYLYSPMDEKVLLKQVYWIAPPVDDDSLVLYSDGKKRGYFNKWTGKTVIVPKYEKAWIFSEGIAGVVLDGNLCFIGHDGEKVFEREFVPNTYMDGYVFHGGYCPVEDNHSEKIGLIDRQGKDVLPFEYDAIVYNYANRSWSVTKDGKTGLLDSALHVLMPCEYEHIFVEKELGIFATGTDHVCRIYDFDGRTVKQDIVIADISRLEYQTEKKNKQGEYVDMPASCRIYRSDTVYPWHYGLISASGEVLTMPLYDQIVAIGRDRFLCQPQGVVLNERGERVEE